MAITPVPTQSTGGPATASFINTYLRDNMQNLQDQLDLIVTSVTWTPVVTQSGTITKTIVEARYTKIGDDCAFWVDLSLTSAGTASNDITMTLPLTAVGHGATAIIGGGTFTDTSVPTLYDVRLQLASTTTVKLNASAGTNGVLGQTLVAAPAVTAIAIASGDFLRAFGLFTWR